MGARIVGIGRQPCEPFGHSSAILSVVALQLLIFELNTPSVKNGIPVGLRICCYWMNVRLPDNKDASGMF